MKPAAVAALATVLGELMALLMRRYGTDDPAEAARGMIEAIRAQEKIEAEARRRHAKRRARK